ncbi:hypothetical protein PC9H_009078 [Pleurotus ostreatus]|uniref:Uncharacterized protein n=1 Tax=Pleurotus ostreatus TaxID=5322 RepID=A0A8H6ZSI4_PLEOS|nr:uncharacterized protein PC9H_009078 [Pleurotus ostreatus]KAF7426709.1 hypothetical protein PC9H_009078 [Pleurotus ostreatus]
MGRRDSCQRRLAPSSTPHELRSHPAAPSRRAANAHANDNANTDVNTNINALVPGRRVRSCRACTGTAGAWAWVWTVDVGRGHGFGMEPAPADTRNTGDSARHYLELKARLDRGGWRTTNEIDRVDECESGNKYGGPVLDLGTPVVRACVRHGVHYVDLTGEPPWLRHGFHSVRLFDIPLLQASWIVHGWEMLFSTSASNLRGRVTNVTTAVPAFANSPSASASTSTNNGNIASGRELTVVKSQLIGQGCPGYLLTSSTYLMLCFSSPRMIDLGLDPFILIVIISEPVLSILLARDHLPALAQRRGVLTPVAAFGNVLVERLERTGRFEFRSEVLGAEGGEDRKRK